MKVQNEWVEFFNDEYAPHYEEEIFTKNTEQEVIFLKYELNLRKGAKILDIGCGTGRHSIALAREGFRMTGVDISPSMLKIATAKAKEEGVELTLIESDAQDISFKEEFDAVICLCEGALSLLGSQDDPFLHDYRILENIYHTLKPGCKFVTTVLNGYFRIRNLTQEDITSGKFDPVTMVETSNMQVVTESGHKTVTVRERVYTPPEFMRMLNRVGFEVEGIYGGSAGDWNKDPVKLDAMEFLAIAKKV